MMLCCSRGGHSARFPIFRIRISLIQHHIFESPVAVFCKTLETLNGTHREEPFRLTFYAAFRRKVPATYLLVFMKLLQKNLTPLWDLIVEGHIGLEFCSPLWSTWVRASYEIRRLNA